MNRLGTSRKKKCEKCGGCCTDTFVPVTDSDVRDLMKKTGWKARSIARLYDPANADCEDDFSGWIRFSYGRRALGLRKRGNRCVFLDAENTCIVYDARPMTCRTFPWMVHFDERGRLEQLFLNEEIGCGMNHGPHIPEDELLANAKREDSRDLKYYRKVSAWNRKNHNGGRDAFFRFVGLEP